VKAILINELGFLSRPLYLLPLSSILDAFAWIIYELSLRVVFLENFCHPIVK
jgi:hypothetical protein